MNVRSLAMGLVLLLAAPAATAWAEDLAEVGKPAPMFRLPVYNPKPVGAGVVGLDRFVGADAKDKDTRVVLLSFMASFCAPCKKEMPWLQQLHEKLGPKGLRVVMVSIDSEPEGQQIIDAADREQPGDLPRAEGSLQPRGAAVSRSAEPAAERVPGEAGRDHRDVP